MVVMILSGTVKEVGDSWFKLNCNDDFGDGFDFTVVSYGHSYKKDSQEAIVAKLSRIDYSNNLETLSIMCDELKSNVEEYSDIQKD